MDIKFIARQANVSIATVSRVLNKSKTVSPDLEKRVLETVAKYHYRPNMMARGLVTNHSQMLGWLSGPQLNMFQNQLLSLVTHYASQYGYGLISMFCDDDFDSRLNAMKKMQAQKMEALMCTFDLTEQERLRCTTCIDIPFFQAGKFPGQDDTFDINESAAFEAVSYLIGLGHTKIGAVLPSTMPGRRDLVTARRSGYLRALRTFGCPVCENYILNDILSMQDATERIKYLVCRRDCPTAIFFFSDETAIGAMFYLAQHGFRIPQDISIVGFDGLAMGGMLAPRLTTVVQPIDRMAQKSVEWMISQVQKNPPFPQDNGEEQEMHYHLLIRESCCPPRPENL